MVVKICSTCGLPIIKEGVKCIICNKVHRNINDAESCREKHTIELKLNDIIPSETRKILDKIL